MTKTPRLSGWKGPLRENLLSVIDGPHDGPIIFDFDHTLLAGDISESLMRKLIRDNRRSVADLKKYAPEIMPDFEINDLWAYYEDLMRNRNLEEEVLFDHLWITQALAGLSLGEIFTATHQVFFDSFGKAPFFMNETIDLLGEFLVAQHDTWIISGSNVYSVRYLVKEALNPLLASRGFPRLSEEKVIGLAPKLKDPSSGQIYHPYENNKWHHDYLLCSELTIPYSSYRGKVDCVNHWPKKPPLFSISDSPTDLPLFEASEYRLWLRLKEGESLPEDITHHGANWMQVTVDCQENFQFHFAD